MMLAVAISRQAKHSPPPQKAGSLKTGYWPRQPNARTRRELIQRVRRLVPDLFEALVFTGLIIVTIRSFIQIFQVNGPSMEPTLREGQRLIVTRFTYRWLRTPRRGEILVFKDPHVAKRKLIKRVIGLLGEKVEVRQGQVYINDQRIKEPYIFTPVAYTWGPANVPQDHYFVLGDNRNYSIDSHSWGWLRSECISGKAWIVQSPIAL